MAVEGQPPDSMQLLQRLIRASHGLTCGKALDESRPEILAYCDDFVLEVVSTIAQAIVYIAEDVRPDYSKPMEKE